MRIGCVVGQRNEDDCLEPWVRYYSYLFGIENVFIIDNGSDSETVKRLLLKYESLGIKITRIPAGTDLAERGNYTADLIKEITSRTHYDFFFPIDCDEFLYVLNPRGEISCNKHEIESYLSSLLGSSDVLGISQALENVHKRRDVYYRRPYKKVFFSGNTCDGLDIGYHRGKSRLSNVQIETKVGYLHFHWRPHQTYVKLARQKLAEFVDVDDPVALANYGDNQPNFHLAKRLLMNETQYDEHLWSVFAPSEKETIAFPQFSNILRMIGIRPDFIDGRGWELHEAETALAASTIG